MAKYDPLEARLKVDGRDRIVMTFREIEELVGELPDSAHGRPQWWANDLSGTHTQARAWLTAGYETAEVDLERERIVFIKQR